VFHRRKLGTIAQGGDNPRLGCDSKQSRFFFEVDKSAVKVVHEGGSHVLSFGTQSSIILDSTEISEFNKSTRLRNFADALFFYLAHEFAHIAQRKHIPAFVDGDASLVVECNADLRAAIAFVMAQPINGADAFQRVRDVIAISAEGADLFPIGVHLSDKVASHPEALQRAACAAKGISAGLTLLRDRQIALAQAAGTAIPPPPALPGDEEYVGLAKDRWQWSIKSARLIGDYEPPFGTEATITWGPEEFRTLAIAAESGPESLAACPVLRSSGSSSPSCAYATAGKSTTATCLSPLGISGRLTFVAYDSAIAMLRPILLSRGWKQESATRSNMSIAESFVYGKARCRASADFSSTQVAIEFSAEE
jgi:hypothetical protein